MTDQINDQLIDEETEQQPGINRRRMFLAGAGLAGAAVIAKAGVADAADGDTVEVGGEYTSETRTYIDNTAGPAPIAGDLNAIRGDISDATNGSHAILAVTAGRGHAIAGVSTNQDFDADDPSVSAKAATWGRHTGPAAAVEGQSLATDLDIAGPGNGVKGIVEDETNGSHAVLGVTNGGGHAVAGDTPADAKGADGAGSNTVAATWGRHGGAGAGIGGVSAAGYGGEFVGGKASVRLIPSTGVVEGPPADAMHMVGELFVDGSGDLYYNTADGSNFTRLNNQGGTVLLSDIQRAYDSREEFATPANPKGRHAAGETREIDLTEFTEFPATASGAIINVTVADTDDNGFALVFNGDTADSPTPLGSSVNWVGDGEFVANGITVATSDTGTVKVFTLKATEIVIDVIGYIS